MSETEQNPTGTTGTNAIEAAAAAIAGDEPTTIDNTPGDPESKAEEFKSEESKRAVLADLHRERETRKALQKKLDEIESANLTDVERAVRETEAKIPAAVADQLRGYLAELHGFDDEDAALYLTSNDPATLLRQASGLVKKQAAPAIPKPDPSQGAQHALALNSDGLTQALERAVGGARP